VQQPRRYEFPTFGRQDTFFKEEREGIESMSKVMEEMCQEAAAQALEQGIEKGIGIATKKIVRNMIRAG